jgi:tetratricopeptide (TPR) repeat protein
MHQELPEQPYQRSESEQQSLDLFHEGQALAASGEVERALAKIEESLVLARNNNDPERVVYLEGTVAYLNGDLEKLKSLVDKAGANTVTLQRLAKGLEARGTVVYKEDYYK